MGVESNEKQNLENFSKGIIEFSSGIQTETSFASFQAALEYVFKLAENERIILAIDEYPYVARSSKSLASTLQLLIDKYKDTSKLMLIPGNTTRPLSATVGIERDAERVVNKYINSIKVKTDIGFYYTIILSALQPSEMRYFQVLFYCLQ